MKKIILIILLLFPIMTYASCDNDTREEAKDIASKITTEVDYNFSSKKFTLTLYNVQKGYNVVYNNKTYTPTNNEIEISGLIAGTNVSLVVNYNSCEQVNIIKESIPYYNSYYGTATCNDYKDVLYVCKNQFTSYNVTNDVIELAIENYNNTISNEEEEEIIKTEKKVTVIDQTKSFINKYGLQITLFLSSGVLTYVICVNIYRKEVHGV